MGHKRTRSLGLGGRQLSSDSHYSHGACDSDKGFVFNRQKSANYAGCGTPHAGDLSHERMAIKNLHVRPTVGNKIYLTADGYGHKSCGCNHVCLRFHLIHGVLAVC